VTVRADELRDYCRLRKIFAQSPTKFDAAISRRDLSDLDSI
jgi:hypothetical protein